MTAATWSCVASLRNPATPFSGVPASSSTTSSICRPPRTPPCALTASAPIFAPRTINCPALASPGGERGVSTPSLTAFCARAGPASPATPSTTTNHIPSRFSIVLPPSHEVCAFRLAAFYAGVGPTVKHPGSFPDAGVGQKSSPGYSQREGGVCLLSTSLGHTHTALAQAYILRRVLCDTT